MSRIIAGRGTSPVAWSQIFLAVALTSAGTLLLELSLTRIFSVVLHYHFAFLAISIALFGLGAGGILSYALPVRQQGLYRRLGMLSAANGAAVIVSLIFIISLTGELSGVMLAAVYFMSALPFVFSGMVLSLIVAETIERVDHIYFFDLLGAAAGCLALVPILNTFGGPNTVLASAILFAVAASIWFNFAGSGTGRAAAVVTALALVLLITLNGKAHLIDIHYAKGRALPKERFSQWNSFSRVSLAPGENGSMNISIDGNTAAGIPSFDWDHLTSENVRELLKPGSAVAYALRPGAKTLVIGPGGGYDIARALASGSKDITGVEINSTIANTVMRQRFAGLSQNLYARPEVHIAVEDGRGFIRRSAEKYQVIQATLVDTWAATAGGAFSLSESNLYTTDALENYFTHLTPNGLLTFTRWAADPPRQSLRLVVLARKALENLGETEAWKNIVILREDLAIPQDTILIFRNPVSTQDLSRIQAVLAERPGLKPLYLPGDAPSNAFGKFLLSRDPAAFIDSYPFNIEPVDDDRPFFFYDKLPSLFWLVAVSLIATFVLLALPPLFFPAGTSPRSPLLYFGCLGVGYILVQTALIQQFILFFGHPAYALIVVIFSMLVSSGFGSYWSRVWIRDDSNRLRFVLFGAALLIAAFAFFTAPATAWAGGWPTLGKMLFAIVWIAPAGFLMGMPFPAGLAFLEMRHPQAIRWAWALNAAGSVTGSIGAIFLAIYLGLRVTFVFGVALYLAALIVARLLAKSSTTAPDSARESFATVS